MILRMENGDLIEWPDIVGIWYLADPSMGSVEDWSAYDVNVLLCGLGFNEVQESDNEYEQYSRQWVEVASKEILRTYLNIELPSNHAWARASKSIELYNREYSLESKADEIGIVDVQDIF